MATPLSLTIKIAADAKGALDSFVALTRRLRESQIEFREAQAKVSALAKEMTSADVPTKKLQKEFDAAKKAVKKLSDQIDANRESVRRAKSSLSNYGIDTGNLTGAYEKLRAESAKFAAAAVLPPFPTPVGMTVGLGLPQVQPERHYQGI